MFVSLLYTMVIKYIMSIVLISTSTQTHTHKYSKGMMVSFDLSNTATSSSSHHQQQHHCSFSQQDIIFTSTHTHTVENFRTQYFMLLNLINFVTVMFSQNLSDPVFDRSNTAGNHSNFHHSPSCRLYISSPSPVFSYCCIKPPPHSMYMCVYMLYTTSCSGPSFCLTTHLLPVFIFV